MVQFLPRIPTFSEQFSQALGQNLQQGMTNLPELAMKLSAQRRGRREEQGLRAAEMLKGYQKDATPLQLAQMAAEAEKFRGSPGDIQKQMSDLVTKEANKLARLEAVHEAPSLLGMAKEFIKEGYVPGQKERIREAQLASRDVDPLVAREKLAKKGFNPEMREMALSKLDPSVKAMVDQLPKKTSRLKAAFEGKGSLLSGVESPVRLDQQRKLAFEDNLAKVLQTNPNANLILLRKEYEKRGVDWKDFKDTIQQLYDADVIDFTEEQKMMLKDLTRPPLDRLEKALRRMKLIKD